MSVSIEISSPIFYNITSTLLLTKEAFNMARVIKYSIGANQLVNGYDNQKEIKKLGVEL